MIVQEKKKEGKREFIVDKAQSLFARFGLAKTSMEDIAGECGMGKSSLYYYFKSKEDVFAAVIKNEFDGYRITLTNKLNRNESATRQFKKYIKIRMDYLKKRADSYTTIADEYLKNYAFIDSIRFDCMNQELDTIAEMIKKGIEDGDFLKCNIKNVSIGIYYALKGLEEPIFNKETSITEVILDAFVNVILNGLTNRENKK